MTHTPISLLRELRTARKRKDLTQRELGERVGLPQSHISRIEKGTVDVQTTSLVELARALELELVLMPRQLLPAFTELVSRLWASTGAAGADRGAESGAPAQVPAFRLRDDDTDD